MRNITMLEAAIRRQTSLSQVLKISQLSQMAESSLLGKTNQVQVSNTELLRQLRGQMRQTSPLNPTHTHTITSSVVPCITSRQVFGRENGLQGHGNDTTVRKSSEGKKLFGVFFFFSWIQWEGGVGDGTGERRHVYAWSQINCRQLKRVLVHEMMQPGHSLREADDHLCSSSVRISVDYPND